MRIRTFIFSVLNIFVVLLSATSCSEHNDEEKPYLHSSPARMEFDYNGEGLYKVFHILSNEQWTINCAESWIHLNSMSGKGDAEISIEVDKNSITTDRSAEINITSQSGIKSNVTIAQEAYQRPIAPTRPEEKLFGRWNMFFIDDGWAEDSYKIFMDITFKSEERPYGFYDSYVAKVYYDLDGDGEYTDYKGDLEGTYSIYEYNNTIEFSDGYSNLPSDYKILLGLTYKIKQLDENTFIFNNSNITLSGKRR